MSGIPFLKRERLASIKWQENDVVVAAAPKTGSTWVLNIAMQCRSGGVYNYTDIYRAAPWLEFVEYPGQSDEDHAARLEAITERPRIFKCHLPDIVQYLQPHVKYIVCWRNPYDIITSMYPFFNNHTDEFRALWNFPPRLPTFEHAVDLAIQTPFLFPIVKAWWPYRHQSNVLFVHYADLKRDPEAGVRRIAGFMGIALGPDTLQAVVHNTSFDTMKAKGCIFELPEVLQGPDMERPIKVIREGFMVREGHIGQPKECWTQELKDKFEAAFVRQIPDAAQRNYMMHAGQLPP